MLLSIYSISITFAWLFTCVYLIINSRRISFLKTVATDSSTPEPSVAVIIAVRNEEAEVEKALKSVCNLDYSNYRIIVINDRSTDATPQILHRIAQENPAVSVITIKDLPQGWLGKNHALYQGYLISNEEWLLFTDADIVYSPLALKKAIRYVSAKQSDHLTALPEINSRSAVFKSVMSTFAVMLEIRLQPWNVKNPKSKAYIGVGAFNLVKRTAYQIAGTHTAISLRPDDDLKLGERVKAAGLRQDVVYGEGELSLEWYTSLTEFINGLMKNTFSVANYHLPTAIAMAITTLIVFVAPIPVLLFQGEAGIFMALVIMASQIVLMLLKRGAHAKWWHALMIPFAGLVMVYILLKSAFNTLQQGGIYWRDSFYPLDELRKQR